MVYVLEWRAPRGTRRPGRCLVSYVRVFRSVAAIKAFVRSRRFARIGGSELRLGLRGASRAGPVTTTIEAILAWDHRTASLPSPLDHSRWEADLAVLGLSGSVREGVAAELERGRMGGLLSGQQVHAVLDLLSRALAGDPLAPD